MLGAALCLALSVLGKLLFKTTQVGNKHFPLDLFQYHCILHVFMNETDLRIPNPQNYFLGTFDVIVFLKRSERNFTVFLLSALSVLETVSELKGSFLVLASSYYILKCLL